MFPPKSVLHSSFVTQRLSHYCSPQLTIKNREAVTAAVSMAEGIFISQDTYFVLSLISVCQVKFTCKALELKSHVFTPHIGHLIPELLRE